MRYAAEFFAPAYAHPKRARAYGASLAELQDALGQLNDGETAARLVATLTGGRSEHAEAAGAVAGWVAARQVAVIDTLAPTWKAFRRAPRFWRAG
jgi:CHAD domain-containing protein